MTGHPTWKAQSRLRFLAHIAGAERRGDVLARLLPIEGPVLEVGCGTGGLLASANRRGVAIEGADVASRWLVVARKRLESADVRLTVAHASALPWPDGIFSAVVADSLLEHLDDPSGALAECLRVARPGGRLVLWGPNRRSLLPDPHTGIWGLGWRSRRRQERIVRKKTGREWKVRPASATDASRMASRAGWSRVVTSAPECPVGAVPGWLRRLYEVGRRVPVARRMACEFGPVWQVTAEKAGAE